ncbi:MAG: reverse transcriptase/maturase family protein, partial [Candidatus Pacebacteria bacterium]|nr:reverse transcriptase/maturase family protein [Candidatus Paceibacterota bacterium]
GGGCFFRKILIHTYEHIISLENLLLAWQEFLRGKNKKTGVQEFKINLADNLINLHNDLINRVYTHDKYQARKINDTKPRDIHIATIRDRVLHRAVYRILYLFFDSKFIYDSYSCRFNKGTHKALNRFRNFGKRVSFNHTKTVWVLKGDIRKCFASIDQQILFDILKRNIKDIDVLLLLKNIIKSFSSGVIYKGLPLGNLTSQLLVNVYLNEFDQFVKHKLKAKYYIRYAYDFVFFSQNKSELENIILIIQTYFLEKLKLTIHPNKIFIKTLSSGVDFLGWIHFSYHRVLRTSTKWRMFRRLEESQKNETLQSYLGMLVHGNGYNLASKIKKNLKLL